MRTTLSGLAAVCVAGLLLTLPGPLSSHAGGLDRSAEARVLRPADILSHGVAAGAVPARPHEVTGPSELPVRPARGPHATSPWTSGAVYAGPAGIASSVATTLRVPDDFPSSTDQYYVALSVFDGAESYDQIGLANDNGSWQVYYATAPACDARPAVHWDGAPLARATAYRFEIAVAGGGLILFEVFSTAGVLDWQETVHTGATYLELEASQVCATSTLPGLTESEMVLASSLPTPPYNFAFVNVSEDGVPEVAWETLSGSSNRTTVVIDGPNVTLDNEPFSLAFDNATDQATAESSAASQAVETSVWVTVSAPGVAVGLSAFTSGVGWTFASNPTAENVSFYSQVRIGLPAATPPGLYEVEIQASDAAGYASRIALALEVVPGLSLSVTWTPAPGDLDANETVTVHENATGGQPGFAYSWSRIPRDCAAAPGANLSCEFGTAGTYTVLAGVSDRLGYALYRNVSVTVAADPEIAYAGGPVTVESGATLSLATELAGGTAPLTILWQGLPQGCTTVNTSQLVCHPSTPGHYLVTVSVTDRTGFHAAVQIPVQVTAVPAPVGLDYGALGLLLVAAGLAVLVSMCVLVLVRRGRRP